MLIKRIFRKKKKRKNMTRDQKVLEKDNRKYKEIAKTIKFFKKNKESHAHTSPHNPNTFAQKFFT